MAGTSAQRADVDARADIDTRADIDRADPAWSGVRHLAHAGATNTRTAPRQARSARSLDLILDAAERLLQVRGVVETSTVDVAAEAGVSVGRLYYWFPDKDAVVQAVLNRAEYRLGAFLVDMIVDDDGLPTPDLIGELLPAIGQFFRQHPGSLAVLQRGPVDGSDPSGRLRVLFVDLVAKVVEWRVPGITVLERTLVADTVVRIVIAMLAPYVRADEEHSDLYLDELGYVVSAYLHCRYPGAHDPVWSNADDPIRPSRRPRGYATAPRRVYPALVEPE